MFVNGLWLRAVASALVVCTSWVCVEWDAARIDCHHTNTGLDDVTDVGFKAFCTGLGRSSSMKTVTLHRKYECF